MRGRSMFLQSAAYFMVTRVNTLLENTWSTVKKETFGKVSNDLLLLYYIILYYNTLRYTYYIYYIILYHIILNHIKLYYINNIIIL